MAPLHDPSWAATSSPMSNGDTLLLVAWQPLPQQKILTRPQTKAEVSCDLCHATYSYKSKLSKASSSEGDGG